MTSFELTSVCETNRCRLFWNVDMVVMSCHDIPLRRNHHYDAYISRVSFYASDFIQYYDYDFNWAQVERKKTWLRWLPNEKDGWIRQWKELLLTRWFIWFVQATRVTMAMIGVESDRLKEINTFSMSLLETSLPKEFFCLPFGCIFFTYVYSTSE